MELSLADLILSIGQHWLNSKFIKEKVHFDGKTMEVIPTSQLDFEEVYYQKEPAEVKQITENPDTEIFFW